MQFMETFHRVLVLKRGLKSTAVEIKNSNEISFKILRKFHRDFTNCHNIYFEI